MCIILSLQLILCFKDSSHTNTANADDPTARWHLEISSRSSYHSKTLGGSKAFIHIDLFGLRTGRVLYVWVEETSSSSACVH